MTERGSGVRSLRTLLCLILCMIMAGYAGAAGAETPASLVKGGPAERMTTNAWTNDDYEMYVVNVSEGLTVIIIWMDISFGQGRIWEFRCTEDPETDTLLASAYAWTKRDYDENNLLVLTIAPDQPCETRIILKEENLAEVRNAPCCGIPAWESPISGTSSPC